MPATAEAHSLHFTTNRNCTIEITNVSSVFCMYNPKVHMESGFAYSPPQPSLRTSMAEICSFTKDDNTASGAVGILTYDLFNTQTRSCDEMMAVMFSVPYDYNFYKNWLGVGIFPRKTEVDEKLFKKMYEDKDFSNFIRHEADGSGVSFKGSVLDVRGCMSDGGTAIIKLEVYDKMV